MPDDPASPSWKVASPRTALSHRFAAHSGRIRYELAELVFDSAEGQLTGVRGSDSTRQVTFHSPGIEIEVAIISDGSRRLVGQLVPAGQPSVALDYESRTVESTADSLGRFSFEDVPLGPISLSIVLADAQTCKHPGRWSRPGYVRRDLAPRSPHPLRSAVGTPPNDLPAPP